MSIYVHKLTEDGKVQYQGKVIDSNQVTIVAQLYSFIDGSITNELVELNKDMNLCFYENAEDMRRNHEHIEGMSSGESDGPWLGLEDM